MNILVTGGAGYIGSVTVNRLVKAKHNVIIFDNLSTGNKKNIHPKAKFIKGDLLNAPQINGAFLGNKIDAVMHFAAFSQVGESVKKPKKYLENNVIGALNLLKAMQTNKTPYIIFSSSAAVFGEPKKTPIKEKAERKPTNPYGVTKFLIENFLETYDKVYKIKHVSLRYFNAAGSSRDHKFGEIHKPETHLIPLLLKSIKTRKTFTIFGTDYPTKDGTCTRDYVHVEDIATAHITALTYLTKKKKSKEYNLGSSKGYSVKDVIKTCEKVTGKRIKIKEGKKRPGDPSILIADNKKIKKDLKWTPRLSLTQMIKDAWEFEKTL